MIPRISIQETAIGADRWEADGRLLQVVWGRFVFEITLARVVRRFDA